MTNKISFSINDVKVVDENPSSNFAVMELDFFASGRNLHDMYVSEETLAKTADTIKNCPLVWKYDDVSDDIYTHTPDEVPCGFVPENAEIKSRKLEDGRTMLSVIAYVWKRYTGELLSFFKRDGFVKPISVEMAVYDIKETIDGLTELLDYKFEGITVLGSYVTPAIPLAKATVLSFSKEYEKLIKEEFSSELYSDINFAIPDIVKENVKSSFEKYSSDGKISSVVLSTVRHIMQNSIISPEKVRFINKRFGNKKFVKNSNEDMNFSLIGGKESMEWVKNLYAQMESADSRRIHYYATEGENLMPYSSLKDLNPALQGIDPPISLSQANAIAKQADGVGSEKGGWGIAIKHFKDSHVVKDGTWVEKNIKKEMSIDEKEVMNMPEEEKREEMGFIQDEVKAEEKMAEIEVEVEDEKEEEEGSEEEMAVVPSSNFADSFPSNFAEMLMSIMEDKSEEAKMSVDEMMRGQFGTLPALMSGMVNQMMAMKDKMNTYMAENEELKKFKADLEEQQKQFAVDATLKELAEKVVIPEEAREEMVAEAVNYSYTNIDAWKTFCKAKSFDFAIKTNKKSDVMKIGLPFTTSVDKSKDNLWK